MSEGAAAVLTGVDRDQRGERRPELHAAGVEPVPDVATVGPVRMLGPQGVDVIGPGPVAGLGTLAHRQHCARPALTLAVLVGLDQEVQRSVALRGGCRADLGLVFEQQHPLEADVANLGFVAERGRAADIAISQNAAPGIAGTLLT